MRTFHYLTNCVNSTAKAIQDMVDNETTVTWKTLIKHIPIQEIRSILPGYQWNGRGLHIKDDYAVSFHRSRFNGKRCYYICHSCIEYVFIAKPAKPA